MPDAYLRLTPAVHPSRAGGVDRQITMRPARAAEKVGILLASIAGLLRTWQAREKERAFLAGLPEFELSRMGLSPEARRREVNKPFWQD
jgi:uncharacterized protein YjiS (DUF1127 family)